MNAKMERSTGIRGLIRRLGSENAHVRKEARLTLIAQGTQAVEMLDRALLHSKTYSVRWEAAKALSAIHDPRAIPALVRALSDPRTEVRWLAAEALVGFGLMAWPEMLRRLMRKNTDTMLFRRGVHHVLHYQSDRELDPQLRTLCKALISESLPVSVPVAAYDLLVRLQKRQERYRAETHRLTGS